MGFLLTCHSSDEFEFPSHPSSRGFSGAVWRDFGPTDCAEINLVSRESKPLTKTQKLVESQAARGLLHTITQKSFIALCSSLVQFWFPGWTLQW
jgi:hypothetical protein